MRQRCHELREVNRCQERAFACLNDQWLLRRSACHCQLAAIKLRWRIARLSGFGSEGR
jgi:hypothetical protein